MTYSRHWYYVQAKLLASKFHNNFISRNKITNKNCSLLDFYLPTPEPYTSLDVAQNFGCWHLYSNLVEIIPVQKVKPQCPLLFYNLEFSKVLPIWPWKQQSNFLNRSKWNLHGLVYIRAPSYTMDKFTLEAISSPINVCLVWKLHENLNYGFDAWHLALKTRGSVVKYPHPSNLLFIHSNQSH